MQTITDEFMRERLTQSKSYCLVILKAGPNFAMAGVREIIWEHGRRNMALNVEGLMPIVCRVSDASEVAGVGIFTVSPAEVKRIMDEDPGVKQGVFVYDIHPCLGFPGSTLPAE